MHPFLISLSVLLQQTPTGTDSGTGTGTGTAPSSGPNFLLPLLLVFGIFWFVMILPERKQRKKRQAMIDALKKGDKVLTSGGIYGVVVQAQEDVITVQVADGVRMRFAKFAIQTVLGDESATSDKKSEGEAAGEKNEKKKE